METIVAEWISAILQNYISEIMFDGKDGLIKKLKHKKFLKKLNKSVIDFCSKNKCSYLDSSAFEYFIRYTDFLNKIVERAVSTKIVESNKVFNNEWIRRARNIAVAENVSFSNNEERLIKDLCRVVDEQVRNYYSQNLSIEQRVIVATNLRTLADLSESLKETKRDGQAQSQIILDAIYETRYIGEAKSELLSEILIANIWEGRLNEFEKISSVVIDKSMDLKVLHDVISKIFISGEDFNISEELIKIKNTTVRDNTIRAITPILFYNHADIKEISGFVTSKPLKTIVKGVEKNEFGEMFSESISKSSGIEVHNFSLNKIIVYEEALLVKQIAIVYLYEQKILNASSAMKDLVKDVQTWFSDILISDRCIDSLVGNGNHDKELNEISAIAEKLRKDESLYMGLSQSIRVLYVGIQVKDKLVSGKLSDVEKIIPDELKGIRPLSDYIYSVRVEKQDVDIEELYCYCFENQTYWLLYNFFVGRRGEKELIDFCISHEKVLEKDGRLFFAFLGALRSYGDMEKHVWYLEHYSEIYSPYYEYWNEKLKEKNDCVKPKFIDACKDGKMLFLFRTSIYLLIERLLNYQLYDEAEKYICKAELLGELDYRINKYRGIIEQGKGRQLEAMKYYNMAFKENEDDAYVVDSIIILSIVNKRKVKKEVVLAAEKIGTARLHSLAAECYLREGNRAKAEEEIKKSILLTEDKAYNPAFGQYIHFRVSVNDDSIRTIKCVDADTVAYCISKEGIKKCLCIYKSKVMPSSPWEWNGDCHVYMDEAAGLEYIRKCKGDWIKIEGVDYLIDDIAPLDFYLFRTCMSKMAEMGVAREIIIPQKNGRFDMQAFAKIIKECSPDEKESSKWLEQYNNIEDVPFPLFAYKRFYRATYLKFVYMIFLTKNIFIRELVCDSVQKNKYIISFAALIMLYKIDFPVNKLVEAGGYITASAFEQIERDVAEIIQENDRETVASMGVFDGEIFVNKTDEDGKAFWIKEAGRIKQYCKVIPIIESNSDLVGEFFEGFDSKEIFGICDYDAISIVNNSADYSLISIEAMLSSLHQNELVKINVTSIVDFLISLKIDAIDFIGYLSKLMDYGCLMSISRNAIVYISDSVKKAGDDESEKIYKKFDKLLVQIDCYTEKNRIVAIQALTESFGQLHNVSDKIEGTIFEILMRNIFILRKQRLQVFLNDQGCLSFAVVDIEPESETVKVEEKMG